MNTAQFAQAEKDGYLTVRRRDPQTSEAWGLCAHAIGLPDVEIVFSITGVRVSWLTFDLPGEVAQKARELALRQMTRTRISQKQKNQPLTCEIEFLSPRSGWVGPIPIEEARQLAVSILALVDSEQVA